MNSCSADLICFSVLALCASSWDLRFDVLLRLAPALPDLKDVLSETPDAGYL